MCVNECILVYITWNIEKRSFFNHSAIVQVITSVFFSKSYLEDKGLNPDDIYSVKYGSKLIQGYGIKPTTKLKFLWIWYLPISPKIKFFSWKVCLDGLPTKVLLKKFRTFLPRECALCNFHYEDMSHLLIDCPFTKNVAFSLNQLDDWPLIPQTHLNLLSILFSSVFL